MNANETADPLDELGMPEPRDSRVGQEVAGMVLNGRIEVKAPDMWPEGASVRVVLVDIQPNTPESIAAWLAEDEARPAISAEDADDILRIIRENRALQAAAALAKYGVPAGEAT